MSNRATEMSNQTWPLQDPSALTIWTQRSNRAPRMDGTDAPGPIKGASRASSLPETLKLA